MDKYGLHFISDEDLFLHVKNTVEQYRFEIDLKSFNKNIIDPIKLTFDSLIYSVDIEDVVKSEALRQIDKSNTNQIGYFHQNIFQYIGENWSVPSEGFDIINESENIFVEMKNKHNTMNSSSSQKTYMKMQNTLLENSEAICMLVEVIAKQSQDITWKISLDKKKYDNRRIKRLSIDKFYELVTGDSTAFKALCSVLPVVIKEVVDGLNLDSEKNSVVKELNEVSDNLLKSLYLLAFKKYEGFDNFDV